ncbi:hypothetical protein O9929_18665 [Vibrio lentus]|nr:hypothetical protein [Vibrio lentus]
MSDATERVLVTYTSTDSNLDPEADIPMGIRRENSHQVFATINDKANGGVVNVLTVDDDTISHNIQQEARKVDFF